MPLLIEQILRIIASAFAGAVIGYEREIKNKPAGFLTFTLVCVGADPSRIIAQVVSGIGFLGAGTIIYNRGNVSGITTAAMLWLVAGLGLLIGTGGLFNYVIAATTLIVILPMAMFSRRLSNRFTRTRKIQRLRVVFDEDHEKEMFEAFTSLGITIRKVFLINKHIQDAKQLKESIIYFRLPKTKELPEVLGIISDLDFVYELNEA